MKKIFMTLFFCMIGLCITSNAVAVTVTKAVFRMDIPTKMTLAREQEADKIQFYTYLYVYSPEPLPADISTLQTLRKILPTQQLMEITAVDSFSYSSIPRGSTVQDYNARNSIMSTSPDPIVRKKQMDEMMASVGTIQLLGIPGLG